MKDVGLTRLVELPGVSFRGDRYYYTVRLPQSQRKAHDGPRESAGGGR